MPSLKERVTAPVAAARRRFHVLDHAFDALAHYGSVNGTAQAGAVTFFGFLSFFPILALGFFFIGLISSVSPELRDGLRTEVTNLLPGIIGNDEGEIPLSTFEEYAGRVGLLGLLGLLYAGLGWLSGMRSALRVMFARVHLDDPSFIVGKLRDLLALVLIGLILLVSVGLSTVVTGFSTRIIEALGFDPESTLPGVLLWVIAHGLAIAASTLLLVMMFQLLAQPHAPRSSLVRGALVGAVGFEILKTVAGFLISQTKGQASFQAFGVALILLVWINYFSRLVMLSAAWAHTSPGAVAQRTRESLRAPAAALASEEGPVVPVVIPQPSPASASPKPGWAGAAGVGIAGAMAGFLVGRRGKDGR